MRQRISEARHLLNSLLPLSICSKKPNAFAVSLKENYTFLVHPCIYSFTWPNHVFLPGVIAINEPLRMLPYWWLKKKKSQTGPVTSVAVCSCKEGGDHSLLRLLAWRATGTETESLTLVFISMDYPHLYKNDLSLIRQFLNPTWVSVLGADFLFLEF